MKFSQNGLYIESYSKCANCGVLIYEQAGEAKRGPDDGLYCSSWCIDWKKDRDERRARANPAKVSRL